MYNRPHYADLRGTTAMAAVLIVAAALCLPLTGAQAASQRMALGPNLVEDGHFAIGDHMPLGWDWNVEGGSRATVTLSDSETHWGHRTMRLRNRSHPAATGAFGSLSQRVRGVRPNTEYLVRVWAKGEDVSGCWFGGGPNWAVRESFPDGSYGWQLLELRLTSPADASPTFDLRINVEGKTDSLWVADITFQELRPASRGSDYTISPGAPVYYPPNIVTPPRYYYPPAYYPPGYWWDPGFTVVVPARPHGWGFGFGWYGGRYCR